MELPDKTYDAVVKLSRQGNDFMDAENFPEAIFIWEKALNLLPEPKSDWEAAMWIYSSIGDAHYQLKQFREAKAAFFDALNCPGALDNPFIHYRLGQSVEKVDGADAAVSHLLKAYMLDGSEIFDADPEGSKYLKILLEKKLI
jgi:tetratricopeptide (TPR) repeat protein